MPGPGAGLAAKVLTVSDGVAAGTRDDRSGRALAEALAAEGFTVLEHRVSADGVAAVADALVAMTVDFAGLVLTTGGTGFGPRDLTPEGTREILEREAPGLGEVMRAASNTDGRTFGMLSRSVCGTRGQSLICNLPGSTNGARECFRAILPAVPHALQLLAGERLH